MLKKIIKHFFNSFGVDIKKFSVENSNAFQTLVCLKDHKIDFIIDIGANTGQFASEILALGYKGEIVSIEPLPVAHKILKKNANNVKNWTIFVRTAIGAYEGNIEINVAGNSVSSSILPMLDAHLESAKESEYIGKSVTKVTTLDKVLRELKIDNKNFFIKIDTQGFEWHVLDGASESLSKAKGVLCELSLIPLYEGQHLWLETIDRLGNLGFKLWAIQSGFTNINTGRTLQIDAIFFKDK